MASNLFDRAISQMGQSLRTQATRRIIYHRGSSWVELKAWEGQTVFRTNTGTQTILDWQGKDFLILSKELVLDGLPTEPTAGDWIERYDASGNVTQWELSAPAGEPHWRKSDPQGLILRVHTKQVNYAS